MNHYERKQEARRVRLEAAADRAEGRAAEHYRKADLREEASGIPLGQPILVGHHSERRHRRAIERAENAMRASIAEDKRAAELRSRAEGVGKGGISSDDPDAIAKLRAQLERAETLQVFMREGNKIIRTAIRKGDPVATFAAKLRALPGGEKVTDEAAAGMLEPDFAGRQGFAPYQLTNNGANIKRLQKRIADLERNADRETVETDHDGLRVVENAEDNRLQIIFPGKPDADMRAALKSHGFRWAPSVGAWQRQLTNGARYAANRIVAIAGK